MTKNQLCTQNYRLSKEADKFQNQRCFVHSFTLSLCVVYIQSTRYDYIVIIMIPGQLVKRRMSNLYISRVLSQWAMMDNDEADSTNLQLGKINRQILFWCAKWSELFCQPISVTAKSYIYAPNMFCYTTKTLRTRSSKGFIHSITPHIDIQSSNEEQRAIT